MPRTLALLWLLAVGNARADELLAFVAEGCRPCQAFKADAAADPGLAAPHTLRILPATGREARAYGVKAVPTFVVIDGRREIARRVGYRGAEDFRAWVDDLEP